MRRVVGTTASVTDLTSTCGTVGSSLTAVDLAGLTKVELMFALVLAAAAGGLVLGLGLAERRRMFAIAAALGANRRQLGGFVLGEAALTLACGLIFGAVAGWGLSHMLVTELTGVFDPPPDHLAIPWAYLAAVALVAVAAIAAAAAAVVRSASRPAIAVLRQT